MTDNLDDLLNEYDGSIKDKKEQEKEVAKAFEDKRTSFKAEFLAQLAKVIKPAAKRNIDKLKSHGHTIIDSTNAQSNIKDKYLQYNKLIYSIILKSKRSSLKIIIAGNYDHQKVFIDISYLIQDKASSLSTETKYDLSDVNDQLIDKLFIDGIKTLMDQI